MRPHITHHESCGCSEEKVRKQEEAIKKARELLGSLWNECFDRDGDLVHIRTSTVVSYIEQINEIWKELKNGTD